MVTLLATAALAGKPAPPPPAQPVSKVFTQPRYGEYCTDPATWVRNGYKVGIWATNVPFKAQAIDKAGYKAAGTFNYSVTGSDSGVMPLVDSTNLVYQQSPYVPNGSNYAYTVTVSGITGSNSIFRAPAKCDSCHSTPPGHTGSSANWGKCNTCHNLGEKIHSSHRSRVGSTSNCYACHPQGCLDTDLHAKTLGFTCVTCHGDLSMTANNTFKIEKMAGRPKCANCHDRNHAEGTALYTDSYKHGGMLCASCHNAPHRVIKPTQTCTTCHTTQAADPKMGANCGQCHKSSVDPHLVNRAR
jgi:hypothetical protein